MKLKYLIKTTTLLFASLGLLNSCSEDYTEGWNIKSDKVEDGIYVYGEATAVSIPNYNTKMHAATNEADGNKARIGFFDIYMYLEQNKDFKITEIAGDQNTDFGPGQDFAVAEPAGKFDQITNAVQIGSYANSGSYKVDKSGLYHIVLDKQLKKVAVIPVDPWAVIGGFSGWADTKMTIAGTPTKEELTYEVKNIELREGSFKLRYGGGWKLGIDAIDDKATVKVNTNMGGKPDQLIPGGDNIPWTKDKEGIYTIQVKWSINNGITANFIKTADVEALPEFPETIYLVGSATAYGWITPGDAENAEFHKIEGIDGIYWKIAHLQAGEGFKVSDKGWGKYNFGFNEISSFDPNGVTPIEAGGNLGITTSGMYTIVVDIRDFDKSKAVKLSITEPKVFGIGDSFGGWDSAVPTNIFTVDNANKNIVSPALTATGNIRTYVQHEWIPAWWNAEFIPLNGVIKYRNNTGDIAESVPGTPGQVITYHFDDNSASIN